MSCGTAVCVKVEAIVQQWMNAHPDTKGIWDVSDGSKTLDVFITVGTRRLILEGLQSLCGAQLTTDTKKHILGWLDDLSNQPPVATIFQA